MKLSNIFLTILLLFPLSLQASDNFADATTITFLAATPTLTVSGSNLTATTEEGEPLHAGVVPNASFWYALTVDEARRVEIVGNPSASTPISNIVMAVYTGNTLADLEIVQRYKRLERPASSKSRDPNGEPFISGARVSFDAEAGTTYYLAIDGELNAKGSFDLSLSTSREPFDPRLELIPTGANWSYYQALTGTNASDPSLTDTDFYATWHTAAAYDGPAFSAPSPSPFSYGTVNGEPVRSTLLVTPSSGQRQAVTYFRTTFTPTKGIQGLGFEGSFDDGAIIYVNGTEVSRLNVAAGTALYNTTATDARFTTPDGALNTEVFIQYATVTGLDLQQGQEVEIAVTLHNATTTSSDAGFHMRVYATGTDPDPIVAGLFPTTFSNSYRLEWQAVAGTTYQVEFSDGDFSDEGWAPIPAQPKTADEDGLINEFVFINTGANSRFWRIISLKPEE